MKRERSKSGLHKRDKNTKKLRKASHQDVAPHSGSLYGDQHRNKPMKGYPGQQAAHDALRDGATGFTDLFAAGDHVMPLEAALHMTALQMHVTQPGPGLTAGFKHGGYPLMDVGKNLKTDKGAVKLLASDIHERREQVKANWHEAAKQLQDDQRKRISMPSPPRDTMDEGGAYMDVIPDEWTNFDSHGSFLPSTLTVDEQRALARQVITPLAEPLWKPAARVKGVQPTAYFGDGVDEMFTIYTKDDNHTNQVGSVATTKYLAGETPEADEIRVKGDNSKAFKQKLTKRGAGAGAHEVLPTDHRHLIASLDANTRAAMAYVQADVRTNTGLTFFRGASK